MENFWKFVLLSEFHVRYVVIGCTLISIGTSIVGVFVSLRKRALLGDVVSHAVLPGICLAFLWKEEKNPIWLGIGAFISGWLAIVCTDMIRRYSKLKEDASLAIVLSIFFGAGIMLLTMIQQSDNASQAGLDSFLFGKAASITSDDVKIFGGIALLIIITITLLYKHFQILCFDEMFAKAIGLPVKKMELLLSTLAVLAVVSGIQSVGVVLISGMLIIPYAAARFWTNRLSVLLLIAALIGSLSSIGGVYVSYTISRMPTGPWIIVIAFFFAFISFIFGTNKGKIVKLLQNWQYQRKILDENILKTFYQICEKSGGNISFCSVETILSKRAYSPLKLHNALQRLWKQGYIKPEKKCWKLTPEGYEKGKRIVKLHRLWEVYLMEHLKLNPEHVHNDAELIEHIITPELEKELEEKLRYPQYDPHQSPIPY
ncbi:MAG: metal ABC transporter permease [Cytophagales bacterium]|nr:metal ABC transporter permease [Cytophagales bacterium]MDW8384513.1 iron chelate uptake ABC transporter family permease subunit [Flammeovirgaceae bacterium]